MIKKEAVRLNMKKIQCNLHGNFIKYECKSPNCPSPYLCSESDCLDQHFHDDGRLILIKFNSTLWKSKLQQVESAINNDTLALKEVYLTKVIDYFQGSLSKIKEDLKNFQTLKFKFCQEDQESFNNSYFDEINGFLCLGGKLQRKIDKLRSKINQDQLSFQDSSQVMEEEVVEEVRLNSASKNGIQNNGIHESEKPKESKEKIIQNKENNEQLEVNLPRKTRMLVESQSQSHLNLKPPKEIPYFQNSDLTAFLQNHISGFSWKKTNVVFSLESQLTTCQKFHEKLKEKTGLLFLFIGDHLTIGSFYSEPYPSVSERFRKDDNSFIFIEDEDTPEKFALFLADPQNQSHISVSQKLLICQGNTPNNGDGLRTFQRNFESLVYFLPSRSFRDYIQGREVNYNGVLKIKQFFILQLLNE